MVQIKIFVFNSFQENTYVLYDESKQCIIIDPGCNNQEENKELAYFIEKEQIVPKAILNTHGHIDHVLGCKFVIDRYKIPFYAHSEEVPIIKMAKELGLLYGIKVDTPPMPNFFLDDGQNFTFGNSTLSVSHIPGHSPGSLTICSIDNNFVLSGDVLFKGSIGRTDLPGGNFNTLINGIKSKLLVLPRDFIVYPGHGPETTIGKEIDTNPFL
jgi:hydroxyacylglutathione hydrolase